MQRLRIVRVALASGIVLITPSLWAASRPQPTPGSGLTPDEVVRQFLKAESDADDATAYGFLSASTRAHTTQKEWADRAHQVRGTFSAITLVAGEALLIGGGNARNRIIPDTMRGSEATVKIVQTIDIPNTLRLVRENGRWVIDLQRTLGLDLPPKPAPKTVTPAPPPAPPAPPEPADSSAQCRYNLRQIGTAFRVYALDHNGRLPDAARWTDELSSYMQSPSLLKCPPDSKSESSYAMNSALSGTRLADIADPSQSILLFESTTTARNASGTGSTLPSTPPHPAGYLVLLVNGQVEMRSNRPVIH